jgi:hypothetical protein
MDNNTRNPVAELGFHGISQSGTSTIPLGVWSHLTVVFNYSEHMEYFYLNGQPSGQAGEPGYPQLEGASGNLSIGAINEVGQYSFFGQLDEARVEAVPRSSNWVWATYMTMASNTAFLSYHGIVSNSPPAGSTIHGITYSWLASHSIANTNDSVETQDPDGDGFNNLQEYIAGTDPTDASSRFRVYIANSAGKAVAWFPSIAATSPDYGNKGRYYRLEGSTNLTAAGSWSAISGFEAMLGNGNVFACTNTTGEKIMFYRARTWLQ